MIDPLLKQQLLKIFHRRRRFKLALSLAACWSVLAIVVLGIVRLEPHFIQSAAGWRLLLIGFGIVAAGILLLWNRRSEPDWHEISRRIELQYPELNGLLLTAAQQQPGKNGRLDCLQQRIIGEALNHAQRNDWAAAIPSSRVTAAQLTHLLALLFLVCALVSFKTPQNHKSVFAGGWTADGVTVT